MQKAGLRVESSFGQIREAGDELLIAGDSRHPSRGGAR